MTDILWPTLAKVLLPAIGIGLMAFVVTKKKLSFAEDIGFRKPIVPVAVAFLALWLVLVAVEELLQASTPKPWKELPLLIVALRILAIGIIGPIAEEFAFRGLLMSALMRTRVRVYGAILITAALWAAIHMQYEIGILAILFVDGVVLGMARHYTGSIYVPIAMHIAGNLFSISQSLRGAA
jgi:membrane protease YdiL (CAAX protease family)